MKLLVRLADLGSFTAVADELNASKSMVSKEISRLEADIGARLLQRSTRNLQLTPVGDGYVQRCREILIKLGDADAYVQDIQQHPRGKLRITASMALGITDLSQMFAEFMRAYPDIELDIHLTDEAVDLIEQGFDLGFRAASQAFDSSLIGKQLTHFRYQVCAAPSYLENAPPLNKPADLLQHNCFVYSYFRGKNVWPLGDGVMISGTLKVNSTIFMRHVIESGLGVGFLPDFVARDAIADGRIVEVLERTRRPQLTLYALYPARHFVPPKLVHCIDFLKHWFAEPR